MRSKVRVLLKLLLVSAALVLMMSMGAHAATEGWAREGSAVVYYKKAANGRLVKATGIQQIGSEIYLFSNTGAQRYGWVQTRNGFWYFKKNGTMGKDLGKLFRSKVIYFDGKYYGFGANGYVLTGFRKVGNYYYFFNTTKTAGVAGSAYTSRWINISGHLRYFTKTGKMVRNAWVGNKFYVDNAGRLLKNTVTPDDYLVGPTGARVGTAKVNGWVKINGIYRYYSQNQHKFLKSCWLYGSEHTYYVNAASGMTRGWANIGTGRYYFDVNGYMQTGVLEFNGKKYLLGDDGQLKRNVTTGLYHTDAYGVITSKGRAKILIVAGHGQGDIGATSTMGYQEYIKTREFSKLIYNKLKADNKVDVELYKNASTSYDLYQQNRTVTRTLSSTVANTSVAALAAALATNPNVPDLTSYDYILEVHFNATGYANKDPKGDGSYKGIGVYYNSGKKDKSLTIERGILSGINAMGFRIWAGAPVVNNDLLNAKICAKLGVNYALLETAFIDDRDDMNFYLKNNVGMAKVVAERIEAFYG